MNINSGPSYWGLLNSRWNLCSQGRKQSPINIETKQLIFDPNLRPLFVSNENNLVSKLLFVNEWKDRSYLILTN